MSKISDVINKDEIFNRFIKELLDYDEIVDVLNNNKDFSKNIEHLSETEKQIELYKYAKQLTVKINNLSQDISSFYVNFQWHDKDQGTKILSDTINLTVKKLEERIFTELDEYFKLNKNLIIEK